MTEYHSWLWLAICTLECSGRVWRLLQRSIIFSFLIGRFVLSSTVFSTSQTLWQITHVLNLCVFLPLSPASSLHCACQSAVKLSRPSCARPCQGNVRCALSHQQWIATVFGSSCWQTMNDSDLKMHLRTSVRALIAPLFRCQQKPAPRGPLWVRIFLQFSLWTKCLGLECAEETCRWKETALTHEPQQECNVHTLVNK